MPLYEYNCSACHKTTEMLQKISDPKPDVCPHCQATSTLTKIVSQTAFVLKGGGWYADAYSSTGKKGGGGSSSSSAGSSTSETSDAKPSSDKKSCASCD